MWAQPLADYRPQAGMGAAGVSERTHWFLFALLDDYPSAPSPINMQLWYHLTSAQREQLDRTEVDKYLKHAPECMCVYGGGAAAVTLHGAL